MLPWYLYTVKLGNMKFGGADPAFVKEFTWCNYIIKYYTIGICGLCGQPVKVWVDKCIVMGEPKFDKDMANQDSQADSANPNELSQRFTNQSTSGAQTMSVQVPQGLQGGMSMQVQTPGGVMQVQIPAGLQPGTAFKIQVPTSVALTAVSQANDLERGGAVPVVAVVAGACTVPSTGPPAQPQAQPAMQKMSVQVPQGLQGGMPMQVQTAGGVMQVLIPAGLQPGTAFEIQVPRSNDPSFPTFEDDGYETFEDDGYTLDKARTALSAGEKVLMADLRQRLGECRKMINQLQGTDYDTSVAGSSPIVGNQVIMWLTETCDINASDAKLYADAFAELGIDTPEDLHMIDGDEVAWPSVVKPVHRKKLQAALESSRK